MRYRIRDLLSFFVIIWAICPALQYGNAIRVVVAISGLIWFLITFSECVRQKDDCAPVMATVCLFCISAIVIQILIGNGITVSIISQLHNIIFLLILCMGLYYIEYNGVFLIKLFKWILLVYLITSFLTLRQGLITPGMSRQMVWSQSTAMMYARKGVGGYGTVYSSIFISSGIMYALLESKSRLKVVYIFSLVIMGVMVYTSGFMISTILQTLMLLFFLFGLHKRKETVSVFFTIIFIILTIWIIFNYVIVENLDVVARLFENTQYHLKVNDIIRAIQTEEITGKLNGRFYRYIESITSVVKFPIFGAEIVGRQEEIGGHSALLDMFSRYGIMFSWGYYYAIIKCIKKLKTIIYHRGFYILMIILVILMGTLNNYSYEHAVAFFIFIPSVMFMVNKDKEYI